MTTPNVAVRISGEDTGVATLLRTLSKNLRDLEQLNGRNARSTSAVGASARKSAADLSTFDRAQRSALNSTNQLVGRLAGLAAAYLGVQSAIAGIRRGLNVNAELESSALGIATIITAQGQLTDATGRTLAGAEAPCALIGHGLLQVAQDFLRIRVTLEQARRFGEVVLEARIRRIVELKRAAIEADGDRDAFHGSMSHVGDGVVDPIPVVIEGRELRPAGGRQAIVLPRRTSVRFLPVVLHEILPTQFAEQGIERAFLRGELGAGQASQDVRHVDAAGADDLQHQELEESLADRGELGFDNHSKQNRYL
jgi:hypothetical protein